jgi:hypothetical protein
VIWPASNGTPNWYDGAPLSPPPSCRVDRTGMTSLLKRKPGGLPQRHQRPHPGLEGSSPNSRLDSGLTSL